MDPQTQAEAKKVEKLLGEIKTNTETKPGKSFVNGVLYGAGIVIGTIIAVVALGWVLSLLGVIPGFDIISDNFSDILHRRY